VVYKIKHKLYTLSVSAPPPQRINVSAPVLSRIMLILYYSWGNQIYLLADCNPTVNCRPN